MFDGQPFFVRIDGRVWVAPDDVPEDAQCTAQTRRRKRCGNPLDYGQSNGFSWLKVPGGYVSGFNYDTDTDNGRLDERGRRYLEQRCELHFDTDAPSAVEPEWVPFVAAEHQDKITPVEQVMHTLCGPGMSFDEAPEPTAPAPASASTAAASTTATAGQPVPVRSPDNDGVPVKLLRPALDRPDLSLGAVGLWSMLVSYYWCCEANRTVNQLHEHRPQDSAETDRLLTELAAADMVTISAFGVVTINLDHLGELAPVKV